MRIMGLVKVCTALSQKQDSRFILRGLNFNPYKIGKWSFLHKECGYK